MTKLGSAFHISPSISKTLQTNLLCHCVMFICVICHVIWAMWPIELVFIINIYFMTCFYPVIVSFIGLASST